MLTKSSNFELLLSLIIDPIVIEISYSTGQSAVIHYCTILLKINISLHFHGDRKSIFGPRMMQLLVCTVLYSSTVDIVHSTVIDAWNLSHP